MRGVGETGGQTQKKPPTPSNVGIGGTTTHRYTEGEFRRWDTTRGAGTALPH